MRSLRSRQINRGGRYLPRPANSLLSILNLANIEKDPSLPQIFEEFYPSSRPHNVAATRIEGKTGVWVEKQEPFNTLSSSLNSG